MVGHDTLRAVSGWQERIDELETRKAAPSSDQWVNITLWWIWFCVSARGRVVSHGEWEPFASRPYWCVLHSQFLDHNIPAVVP